MAFPASLPSWITAFLPGMVWRGPVFAKELYLTFDDGPIPEVTPKILALLDRHQAKATFFCIGHNIHKYPEVFQQLTANGHSIGNHTYHHLNGWRHKAQDYLTDLQACQALAGTPLFRPPYGKLTTTQFKAIKAAGYQVVMWDVLSADYDTRLSPEQVWKRVVKHTRPGSILLFHDSLKAEDRVMPVLERLLTHYSGTGFTFKALPYCATV